MWEIWGIGKENSGLIKKYPYKLQAYIWCWLNKFVIRVGNEFYLDGRVKIKEVKK